MAQAMYDAPGIGLAAPQIGVLKRVIVYDLGEDSPGVVALCNPEIVESSEECEFDDEGCLSLPGITIPVERSCRVTCEAQTLTGRTVRIEADGLARADAPARDRPSGRRAHDRPCDTGGAQGRTSPVSRGPARWGEAGPDQHLARVHNKRTGGDSCASSSWGHRSSPCRRSERLAAEHDVVAVYMRPDAVSGRGGVARPAAVKLAAAATRTLPIRQPATLRDPEAVRELVALGADVICVAAYGLILPPDVLEAAPLGAVNVHASLLPRWRGAAPDPAGDPRRRRTSRESRSCAWKRVSTPARTASRGACRSTRRTPTHVTAELGELGAELLLAALPDIADGTAVWTTQDEAEVTYAAKVTQGRRGARARPERAREPAAGPRVARRAPARILIGGEGS